MRKAVGNFFIEEKGAPIGLPNTSSLQGHPGDRLMQGQTVSAGVAVHAPIAKGVDLSTTGEPGNGQLEKLQFWYSCLHHFLLERSAPSVQKSFLLGALDSVSNADSTRKTAGLDWQDNYAGEFPTYSIVHAVGHRLLNTFEGEATQNPRFTQGRLRGRIARAKLWEVMSNIGFISELRAVRARDYEPDIASIPLASFPAPNCLSVITGSDVLSLENSSHKGSDELELFPRKLFKLEGATTMRVVTIPVQQANLYAVGSLPFGGMLAGSTPQISSAASSQKLRLASSAWEQDALERIYSVGALLPAASTVVANDKIFEYLIALLASRLPGCREAWVVPRPEDLGVDVGALFDLGSELGSVTAIYQAKLQGQNVGRRVIDMLRGALYREGAVVGYVVTNSGFTLPARRSAERDYPEIRLLDGKKLVRLLLQHEVGLFRRNSGRSGRVFLDLTFFDQIRDLVVATATTTGKIRVAIDANGMPTHLTT